MTNDQLPTRSQVSQLAQEACRQHGKGFAIDSVDVDPTNEGAGFAVTLSQPKKPDSTSDQEWWQTIKTLRTAIERINGVNRVYIVVAERS